VFAAAVTGNNLGPTATAAPVVSVAVEHNPALTLSAGEDSCVLRFTGKFLTTAAGSLRHLLT